MIKLEDQKWKVFFPEDGECEDDARDVPGRHRFCIDAAERAAEMEYDEGGWERNGDTIKMVLIGEDGRKQVYSAWSEPTVHHFVREIPS
jgi:hypothetical protein